MATTVLNADLRSPTQLAWEAVTLDHLSHGRFELGVGAGHTPQEYRAVGVSQRPGSVRKQRLTELVEIVRRLVDGETVKVTGDFLDVDCAHVGRSAQEHLPIFVGENGDRLLQHAGRLADIVGLQGLGRMLADGHRHKVMWTVEHLDHQLEQIRVGAEERVDDVELNAMVQVVELTDDRSAALDRICSGLEGFDREAAEIIPYLLVGSVDEIVNQLHEARRRWGIQLLHRARPRWLRAHPEGAPRHGSVLTTLRRWGAACAVRWPDAPRATVTQGDPPAERRACVRRLGSIDVEIVP